MTLTEKLNEPLRTLLAAYLEKQNRSDNGYDYLDMIGDYLHDKKMALCIGSGLTREFVGEWRTLEKELLFLRCSGAFQNIPQEELAFEDAVLSKGEVTIASIKNYIESLKKPFLSSDINTIEIGEYLMYDAADTAPVIGAANESVYRETFFAEQVHFVISSSIKKKIGTTSLEDYFFDNCKDDSKSTLAAIVKLCIKKDIRTIVTYNFDTILDHLLASLKIRKLFGGEEDVIIHVHSYHKAEPVLVLGTGKGSKINIYHVHGIVDDKIEKTEPIIFSENSYQSYQKTSLNWSNIRLADIMSRFHVLCVGFSGDDANFRMLRRFLTEREANPVMGAKGERKDLFLMRSYQEQVENLADLDKANEKPACAFACVRTYFDIVRAYFEVQLETHIVWSNGFEQMADQLNALCE